MAKPKTEASFEKNLEELEAIVAALEGGELSLDESLKQFEQGIRLSRTCEKALLDAEKKIEILTKNAAGDLEALPFDEETGAPVKNAKSTVVDHEPEPDEPEGLDDEDSLF
jgi:exodeoxyribonuclease VII small subunit